MEATEATYQLKYGIDRSVVLVTQLLHAFKTVNVHKLEQMFLTFTVTNVTKSYIMLAVHQDRHKHTCFRKERYSLVCIIISQNVLLHSHFQVRIVLAHPPKMRKPKQCKWGLEQLIGTTLKNLLQLSKTWQRWNS